MPYRIFNQDSLYLKHTYAQIYALSNIQYNIIVILSLLPLLIITLIAKKCINSKKQQPQNKKIQVFPSFNSERQVLKQIQIQKSLIQNYFINFIIIALIYAIFITVSLIFWTYYSIGTIGRSILVDIGSVLIMTSIVVIPIAIWKCINKSQSVFQSKQQTIFITIILIIWLVTSIVLIVIGKGVCKCYYNDNYDQLSTQFTRSRQIQKVCPAGKLCHLYATLPQQTSTAVFFNVHAATDLVQLTFVLKQSNVIIKNITNKKPQQLDNVQSIGQRNIFSVYMDNLIPNTKYQIIIYDSKGLILKSAKYKTLSVYGENINIISGGDIALNSNGRKMTSYLIDINPDVIILGGDTVYDNGMRTCYYSWDNFYWMFQKVFEKVDRIIPLIMSIGNHDVGYDAFTIGKISMSSLDIPLFLYFNPQHKNLNYTGVPLFSQRRSYHYHVIGNFILFCLDSGYVTSSKQQADFINTTITLLSKQKKYYYMASYHNPIYPSCLDQDIGSNDMIVIKNGLKYWVPLFDEYKFVVVMQHHTHFRKVTYKIKNNTINDKGTRYIGDGSWGVNQLLCPSSFLPTNIFLFENYAVQNNNHLWKISIQNNKTFNVKSNITYLAVGINNTSIDFIQDTFN